MTHLRLGFSILAGAFCLGGCAGAPDDAAGLSAPAPLVAKGESITHFMAAQDGRKATKDFPAMLQAGQKFAQTHPENVEAFSTSAYAAYQLGDLDSAVSAWKKCIALAPQRQGEFQGSLDTAQTIQKRWPGLELGAPVWADSDADLELDKWRNQASKLLNARRYDEIEAIAARLQKSGAQAIDGNWLLDDFAQGLWMFTEDNRADANWRVRQKQLEAWHAARPGSLLARIALMAEGTNGAWLARGEEYADKINSQQWKTVNTRLAQAAQIAPTLVPDLAKSPLVAARLQKWALLAAMPVPQYQKLVGAATKRFPTFTSYDIDAVQFLMPRWFGQTGDWENYATQRADELGGEAGDMLYARLVASQSVYTRHLRDETSASYPRAKRGFDALLKAHPGSISIATVYLQIAMSFNDQATAQRLVIEEIGNRAQRVRWTTPGGFGIERMKILSAVGQRPYSKTAK